MNWAGTGGSNPGRRRCAPPFLWQKTTSIIGLVGGFIPGPPSIPLAAISAIPDAIGGEISLTGRIAEDWRWDVGYRLETVKDKFTPLARAGFAFSDYQHTTPRHQVKAGLGWRSGNWEIDTALSLPIAHRRPLSAARRRRWSSARRGLCQHGRPYRLSRQ